MAKVNIAQDEQKLKSLEHSLKEIGDQHQQMYTSLTALQDHCHQTLETLHQVWSQIIHLFVTVEELRRSRQALETELQTQEKPR